MIGLFLRHASQADTEHHDRCQLLCLFCCVLNFIVRLVSALAVVCNDMISMCRYLYENQAQDSQRLLLEHPVRALAALVMAAVVRPESVPVQNS